MSKRSATPLRRAREPVALAVLACAALAACGAKPEQRIKDPDCDHCYELESGVKYKTFEYYDP